MTDSPDPQHVDLDAIGARAEKATPGPWEFSNSSDPRGGKGEFRAPDPHNGFMLIGPWCDDADPEFIAAARTDVPTLVQRVRELEKENEDLRQAVIDVGTTSAVHGPFRQ